MSGRRFRKPPWMQRHVGNRLAVLFGPAMIVRLSTRGRRSGRWRTTPVVVLEHGGERYLVSYRGLSDWALNLCAFPHARLTRRDGAEEVDVEEVAVEERGPLLAVYAERYSSMPTVGAVLRALPEPADHPTFRIVASRAVRVAAEPPR